MRGKAGQPVAGDWAVTQGCTGMGEERRCQMRMKSQSSQPLQPPILAPGPAGGAAPISCTCHLCLYMFSALPFFRDALDAHLPLSTGTNVTVGVGGHQERVRIGPPGLPREGSGCCILHSQPAYVGRQESGPFPSLHFARYTPPLSCLGSRICQSIGCAA